MRNDGRPVVVFAGGGTGGHLYPALALAEELGRRRPDVRAVFVGATGGLEARVLAERGVEHALFPVRGLRRDRRLANVAVAFELAASVVRAGALFRDLRPEVVVVTGGYAAAPPGLAGVLLGVPLVLQEQNSLPGVVTRLLAPFARRVHVAFPEAVERLPGRARARAKLSGNPVRSTASRAPRAAARRQLGLPEDGRLVLATGGSQGSRAINAALLDAVAAVERGDLTRAAGLRLLWVTGPTNYAEVQAGLEGLGPPAWVHVKPYEERMELALDAADLAVGRGGAMTIAELHAWGLPAVLVPLPTAAEGHQALNAQAVQDAGAGVHLPQSALDGPRLWSEIERLAAEPALSAAAAASAARALPAAARAIADDIATLLPPSAGSTP